MLQGGPDETEALVSEVCWHYYVNEMTQAEVAQELGITRLRVNQAIQKAKSLGMVKVQIESPFLARVELQEALKAHLGIDKVLVVPANREAYDYHAPVGAALASYLGERVRAGNWKRVGVSWGMTLQSAIHRLPKQSRPDLEVVSMIGGSTKGASFNAFGIASGFAERLGANYSILAAPIYLPKEVDRDAFLTPELFGDHFEKCRNLDAALLVVGDVSDRSYLVSTGLPGDVTPDDLLAQGAVGDMLGRFLDVDGNVIAHGLNERTVGIDLETVRAIPEKVLAASGHHKVRIIRAAIRCGLANTLITDDVTGEGLLKT